MAVRPVMGWLISYGIRQAFFYFFAVIAVQLHRPSQAVSDMLTEELKKIEKEEKKQKNKKA